jgi:hypothetical protein
MMFKEDRDENRGLSGGKGGCAWDLMRRFASMQPQFNVCQCFLVISPSFGDFYVFVFIIHALKHHPERFFGPLYIGQ